MIRAMITKELRTTMPIAAIGLAIIGWLVYSVLSRTLREFPLLDGDFLADWSTAAWLLAIVLGLSQSAWERKRGTDLFLLHRPARRAALLAVKVAVGAVLLELAAGLPALLGGFSLSGRHRYAGDLLFAWWMTEPVWRVWLALPVVYLAAFLGGMLPGRWRGVRLLPLVAASGLIFWLNQFVGMRLFANSFECGVGDPGWLAVLGFSAAASAVLVYLILQVAENRDFG